MYEVSNDDWCVYASGRGRVRLGEQLDGGDQLDGERLVDGVEK